MAERVWSIRGMTLTEENQSAGRKYCPGATSTTTIPTRTGLGLNPGLHTVTPATKLLAP